MKKIRNDKNLNISKQNSGSLYSFGVALILIFSLLLGFILPLFNLNANSFAFVVFSYLCPPLSLLCAVLLLNYKDKRNYFTILKPTKTTFKVVIASFLLSFGLFFGFYKVNDLIAILLKFIGYNPPSQTLLEFNLLNFITVIICVCILPALFEEGFFRGLITVGLNGKSKIKSVLFSGLLFSIFHMNPLQTVYQFIAGCVFALIVLSGGNYLITFLCHLINNLLIVIFYYFGVEFPVYLFTVLGLVALVLGTAILYPIKNEGEIKKGQSSFIKTGIYGVILCIFMWIINLFSYMVW